MERDAPRDSGMLAATLHLGRIGDIAVRLHFSWFIIALLITLSLAGQFRLQHPDWHAVLTRAVCATTAVRFFVTQVTPADIRRVDR